MSDVTEQKPENAPDQVAAAVVSAAWEAGAMAMKKEAVGACAVVLAMLEDGVISGSAVDFVRAIQEHIETSTIPTIPQTYGESGCHAAQEVKP